MAIYWLMFWIFIGITAYGCYCWGKGEMVYPKFKYRNGNGLKRIAGDYYVKANGHQSACTCVDCNDIRLRKSGLKR
jgi:hypothetical protein